MGCIVIMRPTTKGQKMKARNIEILTEEIKKHNNLYRAGVPVISDAEYDVMVSELKSIDPDNEWFKHTEPGHTNPNRKVKLPIPMKSLNKAKSLSDIKNWLRSIGVSENEQLVIMPKFDGVSLLYSYTSKQAFSRGGSENEGQDCTPHYQMLRSTSVTELKWNCVFGELVFNRRQWEENFVNQISPETGDKYKSPRNTAAGFINRDIPSESIKHIDFYRYGVDEESLHNFKTYHELLIHFASIYTQRLMLSVISSSDLTEEKLLELFSEYSRYYYIDGLVIYINDLRKWENIGRHQTTGNPLYAYAYKHPDFTESFVTTVKGITWKASKSGALKPVVNIEAVDTGDCNMENPTGYNANWVNEHEIGVGAEILVTRSGGVIPKILKTITPASQEEQEKLWDDLCECPHCGAPTAWNKSYVELCCTNKQCSGIQLAKLVFFYITCGAENVGEETLSKIYNAGYKTITELLNITFEELLSIDGFGESTANSIMENNRKILEGVDIYTLMHASDCFSGIGKVKAQQILEGMSEQEADDFKKRTYLPYRQDNPLYKSLSKTQQAFENGVIPFYNFLQETNIPIINIEKTPVDNNGKCSGMNVCFSGIRDAELEGIIKSLGGSIASGINKKTTHLIVKDINATSSKIIKAKDLGVSILSIENFKSFIL